ncbi:similar to Saccharomyces cerevisiae YLL014W EMC6 Member of a transmembrane complex required for efficient folding of proteins in the ER [Maudiozyma barnettii]|uniref:ER membrane protein complex subunit 6 n=1 Tax=Maudiozyma barnettii TaxID=61262 RepID=A0A8H2ZIQ8_9SACH|nr:Emc6p [Kazachstania barnettii]CAB4255767.1 similar to Saccharomyces cerevisiae YLL014W EMC6 Member of a transmembrane complex required for efficient folding of proteins in the ER [Kazachstania barnettii]CAD1784328.1 similar to Saccharomyces cerevisiae YLL014W EMC6 Member of a transmembrane complex required for efficient folding of proteins in the ER [Kazachstania barnettii]
MESNDQFSKQVKSGTNTQENKKRYETLMDKVCLMAGVVTGILQFESTYGFLAFLITYLLTAILYVIGICGGHPELFYENIISDLLFDNFIRELMGFIMAWTFSFALIG